MPWRRLPPGTGRMHERPVGGRQKRTREDVSMRIDDSKDSAAPPESDRSSRSQASSKRVSIGTLPLDPVTLSQAVLWILGYLRSADSRLPARISCPNASLIVLAEADPGFAKTVSTANVVVADGKPLLWAAFLLGTPLPGQVRGVELMEQICAGGAAIQMSIYIVGGLPGAAEKSANLLVTRYPGLRLAGTDCPVLHFEQNAAFNEQVLKKITAAAPDFLIVALGSPKQEWWIDRYFRDLPVGAIIGVGAAVDTYAGLRRRPPAWMQKVGLEWLGRLLREPGRLWRRYLFGNGRFLYIVVRQLWLARKSRNEHIESC